MTRNPYEATTVNLTTPTNKLYSPRQAMMASFFGGPFAAVYVVRSNYRELKNATSFRAALRWGALLIVALLLILPFLPEKFPNTAIPLGYSLAVGQLVEKNQMTKEAISKSETYMFQSNWRVAGVAALSLLLFLAVSLVWMLALEQFGLVSL